MNRARQGKGRSSPSHRRARSSRGWTGRRRRIRRRRAARSASRTAGGRCSPPRTTTRTPTGSAGPPPPRYPRRPSPRAWRPTWAAGASCRRHSWPAAAPRLGARTAPAPAAPVRRLAWAAVDERFLVVSWLWTMEVVREKWREGKSRVVTHLFIYIQNVRGG